MENTAFIPNKQLEEMFLRIANDYQVRTYISLIDRKNTAAATSYASRTVYKKFFIMIETLEKGGE